jgi:ferric-dicitrate binding protein FerR (iron transport regulator)
VNNAGERQTVTLPDGSYVVIMDGTAITVSKGFAKEDRDVEIDGRGVFVVRALETMGGMGSKPFVVHTGNLLIQVLDTTGAGGSVGGTGKWEARFAVEAVRKQPGEETDLLDGKLRVTKSYHSDTDNEPEVLGAGDMVMINREIDLMEKEKMTGPEEDKVKEKYHIAR